MTQKNDLFEEKERNVVISSEDVKNVRDFMTHFKIAMPADLEKALSDFESSKTFENQEELKVQLCKMMVESDHALLKDELFSQVIDNSSKIVQEALFDKAVKETLSAED